MIRKLKIYSAFCVGFILFGVRITSANDLPPSFHDLPNKTENSALSAECQFTDNTKSEITCDYVQLSFRRGEDAEIQKMDSVFRNASLKDKKELKETQLKLCDSLPSLQKTPLKGGSSKVVMDSLAVLCSEGYSFNKTVSFFKFSTEQTAKTCKVYSNTFSVTFNRMGENKWISSSEPSGLCEVSTVISLEAEKEYRNLWTQKQIRMGVGKSDSEFCKGFEVGVMYENSWKFDESINLEGCRYLEFGQF